MRDKRERFVMLAEARTAKALNAIRLLGNLSNRSNYEFRDTDVQQIIKALEGELKQLKSRFADSGTSRDASFHLRQD